MKVLNVRYFIEAYDTMKPSILTWEDRNEQVYDFLQDVTKEARIWERKRNK